MLTLVANSGFIELVRRNYGANEEFGKSAREGYIMKITPRLFTYLKFCITSAMKCSLARKVLPRVAWGWLVCLLLACPAAPALAAQSIRIKVVDQKGDGISTFHYDNDAFFHWSGDVLVRNATDGDRLVPACPPMSQTQTACEPFTYLGQTPVMLVEVMKDGAVVGTTAYSDGLNFSVPGEGLYTIRVSTTFQYSETVMEPISAGTIFDPITGIVTIQPSGIRTDRRGQFEVSRTELVDLSGVYFYRYYKHYTYNLITTVKTYVSAGEADFALVVLPHDPEIWAAASPQGGPTYNYQEWSDGSTVTTAVAKNAMSDAIRQILPEADNLTAAAFGYSLLSSHLANVIICVASPQHDLTLTSLVTTTIGSVASRVILVQLGLTAVPGAPIAVGVAVGVTISEIQSYIVWQNLKHDLGQSCGDDLLAAYETRGLLTFLHVRNLGGDLSQVKLGALRYGQIVEYPDRGSVGTLSAGMDAVFSYWPEAGDCLDCEPVIIFTPPVLTSVGVVQVYWPLSSVRLGTMGDFTPPPKVVAVGYGTDRSTSITVSFSKDIDAGTLVAQNVSVVGSISGGHAVVQPMPFDHGTFVLTIDPLVDFAFGETVTVTLSSAICDLVGKGLDGDGDGVEGPSYVFSFVIGAAPGYTISATAGSHGAISPSGAVSVPQGGSRSFMATADSGYAVDAWYLDGSPAQAGNTLYTVSNVQFNRAVYVAFRSTASTGITITAPNGGGAYARGRKLYINWKWNGAIGQYVNIDLLKGGTLNTPIATAVDNSGVFTWTIPSGQTLGTDYRVRVTIVSGGPTDQSDSDFEITAATPTPTRIEIGSLSLLEAMSEQWGTVNWPCDADYVLTTDIDAHTTGSSSYDGGLGFKPIGNGANDWFRGTFDGQGHQITGLYLKRPAEENVGLFQVTRPTAVIKNLNLELRSAYANKHLGGIAGENDGLIQNCVVTVDSGYTMYITNGYYCGGIAGENFRGTILNCGVEGTTAIQARGSVGGDYVGGIAGLNSGMVRWCWVGSGVSVDTHYSGSNGRNTGGIVGDNAGGNVWECQSGARVDAASYSGGVVGDNYLGGVIQDCYYRGSGVSGSGAEGGLAGYNELGTVSRCYVSGAVTGTGTRGALFGNNDSVVQVSYWNTDASGALSEVGAGSSGSGCFGRTSLEMMQLVNFTNWDFTGIWAITNGVDFPVLRGVGGGLSVPLDIVASTGLGDGVHVNWTAVPDATYYMVFRSDAVDGPKVALASNWVTDLAFVDTSATPLNTFYYWVKAGTTPDGGRGSEFSSSATGSRTLPPVGVPQGISASDGLPFQVVVEWLPTESAGYYQLYRGATAGGAKVALSGWQTNTIFFDTSGGVNVTNYYWVRAAASAAGDRASDYSVVDTGCFVVPGAASLSVAVTSSPALPLETQSINLTAVASNNAELGSLTIYWDDGVLQSNRWQLIAANSALRNQVVGPYSASQALTFWAVAGDVPGNRSESEHTTVIVQAETVTAPTTLSGPATTVPDQVVEFTTGGSTTTLGGIVEYQFDWGTGEVSSWGEGTRTYAWTNTGFSYIRARARSQVSPSRVSDWSIARSIYAGFAPSIGLRPQDQMVLVGANVAFSVSATGTAPLIYQWFFMETNALAGATGSTLGLTNVQRADAGRYSVTVSNLVGSTNVFATLVVQSSDPLGAGLVAYYPFDGSATNILGTGNDGTVRGGILATDLFGFQDRAYALGGSDDIVFPSGPPVSPTGSFTYAFWMISTRVGDYPGYGYGHLWFVDRTSSTAPLVSLATMTENYGNASKGQFWFFPRYNDNTSPPNSDVGGGVVGGMLTPQQWQHIAMIREYSNSFKLYVNGVLAGSAVDNGRALTPPAVDLGKNPLYGETGLVGKVDDFRIYNRALDAAEVSALAGRVSAARAGTSLVLNWYSGVLVSADEVSGPWIPVGGATSPWMVTPGTGKKFFRIQR
jgi:hypothetical protein